MAKKTIASNLIDTITKRSKENFELHYNYINPSHVDLLKVIGLGRRFVSAKGFEMYDDKGRVYIDFLSGYGVHNLGYNHPVVKETIKKILDRDVPGFSQVDCGFLTGLAAEQLVKTLPKGLNRVYFCSSGSEAVDAAVKLARAATKKKRVICCQNAFHGTTLSVLAMTDNPDRRDRFRPLIPGTMHVPPNDIDALKNALRWKDAAAFIFEPVQGEAGAVVPEPEYLREAQKLCNAAGTLFIADEVQTGLGRTGRMFAFEHTGIRPHAIALAKSLSGGLVPTGAMIADEKVFKKAYGSVKTCLDHKTTFSGGPLAMAAVLSTLAVIEDEKLVESAAKQGEYLKDKLLGLAEKHKQIHKIQGMGLMLTIKFHGITMPGLKDILPRTVKKPGEELYTQYVALQLLTKYNIITQVSANDFSTLKIMPPLNITVKAIDTLITALDEILKKGNYSKALLKLAKELNANRKINLSD
ncbi:MAG: aspartate aminotransferase family protein [bacterium]|nr:aspartate aminotransferase family protein [bacterium]